MSADLPHILEHYQFKTGAATGERFGNGRMHDTYFVPGLDANAHSYIIQKINDHVFRDVSALMHNIERVTHRMNEWIRNRISLRVFRTKSQTRRRGFSRPEWRLAVFRRQFRICSPLIFTLPFRDSTTCRGRWNN